MTKITNKNITTFFYGNSHDWGGNGSYNVGKLCTISQHFPGNSRKFGWDPREINTFTGTAKIPVCSVIISRRIFPTGKEQIPKAFALDAIGVYIRTYEYIAESQQMFRFYFFLWVKLMN